MVISAILQLKKDSYLMISQGLLKMKRYQDRKIHSNNINTIKQRLGSVDCPIRTRRVKPPTLLCVYRRKERHDII